MDYKATYNLETTEEQEKRVDVVCFKNAKNVSFHEQTSMMGDKSTFKFWNNTSVGNCAFCALNAPEKYRDIYRKELEDYLKWVRGLTNNQIKDFGIPTDEVLQKAKFN